MGAVGLLRILLACCKDTPLLNWIWNLFKSGHIQHVLVQSQQWKQQNIQWNIFKYNDKSTRTTSMEVFCQNSSGLLAVNYFHKKGSIDVVLVFSLFTLSRFHTLLWCIGDFEQINARWGCPKSCPKTFYNFAFLFLFY